MENTTIPVWQRYALTVTEAAEYYHIGESKLRRIAEEHPDFTVGKIDIDEEQDLAEEFGVMSIPTLVVLKDGEIVTKHVGALSKARILELLQ